MGRNVRDRCQTLFHKIQSREGQVHTEAVAGLGREPRAPAHPISLSLRGVSVGIFWPFAFFSSTPAATYPVPSETGRFSKAGYLLIVTGRTSVPPRPRLLSHDRKGIKVRRRPRELWGPRRPCTLQEAGRASGSLPACSAAASGLAVGKTCSRPQPGPAGLLLSLPLAASPRHRRKSQKDYEPLPGPPLAQLGEKTENKCTNGQSQWQMAQSFSVHLQMAPLVSTSSHSLQGRVVKSARDPPTQSDWMGGPSVHCPGVRGLQACDNACFQNTSTVCSHQSLAPGCPFTNVVFSTSFFSCLNLFRNVTCQPFWADRMSQLQPSYHHTSWNVAFLNESGRSVGCLRAKPASYGFLGGPRCIPLDGIISRFLKATFNLLFRFASDKNREVGPQ